MATDIMYPWRLRKCSKKQAEETIHDNIDDSWARGDNICSGGEMSMTI